MIYLAVPPEKISAGLQWEWSRRVLLVAWFGCQQARFGQRAAAAAARLYLRILARWRADWHLENPDEPCL